MLEVRKYFFFWCFWQYKQLVVIYQQISFLICFSLFVASVLHSFLFFLTENKSITLLPCYLVKFTLFFFHHQTSFHVLIALTVFNTSYLLSKMFTWYMYSKLTHYSLHVLLDSIVNHASPSCMIFDASDQYKSFSFSKPLGHSPEIFFSWSPFFFSPYFPVATKLCLLVTCPRNFDHLFLIIFKHFSLI